MVKKDTCQDTFIDRFREIFGGCKSDPLLKILKMEP